MKCTRVMSLLAFWGCLGCLVGCRPAISPLEQVDRLNPTSSLTDALPQAKVVNTPRTAEYLCAEGKVLQIQTQAKSKKITLTFNQISHRLSPTLSRSGKKYSNIRWIWFENTQGVGYLQDNRQNHLAEQCVKKEQ